MRRTCALFLVAAIVAACAGIAAAQAPRPTIIINPEAAKTMLAMQPKPDLRPIVGFNICADEAQMECVDNGKTLVLKAPNQTVHVRGRVVNYFSPPPLGGADTPPGVKFKVKRTIRINGVENVTAEFEGGPLASGGQFQLPDQPQALQKGKTSTITLEVTADTTNKVVESSETNNGPGIETITVVVPK